MADRERGTGERAYPTADELHELFLELKDDTFRRFLELAEEDDDFLQMASSTTLNESDQYAEYFHAFDRTYGMKLLPLASSYVNRGVTNIVTGDFTEVEPVLPKGLHKGDSKAEQDHITLLRTWCEGFWAEVGRRAPKHPDLEVAGTGIALGYSGYAFPLVLSRYPKKPTSAPGFRPNSAKFKEAMEEYEDDLLRAWPWDVRYIHPRSFLFDPDHTPPEYFFEFSEIPIRIAAQEYPGWQNVPTSRRAPLGQDDKSQSSQKVERIVYVDEHCYCVWIDGDPVLTDGGKERAVNGVAPNTLGFAWYETCESGTWGLPSHNGEMHVRLQGMVRGLRSLIVSAIETFNVRQHQKIVNAFGVDEFTYDRMMIDQAEAEAIIARLSRGPGRRWVLPNVISHHNAEGPQVNSDLLSHDEETQRYIALIAGPDVLAGAYKDEPNASLKERRSQAMAPFRPMQRNMEQTKENVLLKVLRSIKEEVRGPVTVWIKSGGKEMAVTLRPEDIPSRGLQLRHHLSAMTETEKEEKWTMAMAKYESMVISRQTLAQAGDVADPDAEQKQRYFELLDTALDEVGIGIAQQASQTYYQNAGVLPPPPPPMPVGPDGQPLPPEMAAAGAAPGMQQGQPNPMAQPIRETTQVREYAPATPAAPQTNGNGSHSYEDYFTPGAGMGSMNVPPPVV